MAKEMAYKNALAIDEFVYDVLAANPIGKYHRMEDIYDDVLRGASIKAKENFEKNGKAWPPGFKEVDSAVEPYILEQYMEFVDKDRNTMLEEIERRGISKDKVFDAFINALNKIRVIDDKKEFMDALAENAYAKCALNLVLYELLK